jgi:hypothetical protein
MQTCFGGGALFPLPAVVAFKLLEHEVGLSEDFYQMHLPFYLFCFHPHFYAALLEFAAFDGQVSDHSLQVLNFLQKH